MTVLDRALAVQNSAMKRVAGITVTVRRGNDAIDGLVVVPLATRHDEFGEDEVALSARDRDWLVWAADYAFGGQVSEPTPDDEIDWVDPRGQRHTYQVALRAGDRCFRHTDQTLQQLRIYTVEALPNAE